MPESEWELYALDQLINDRGVRVDKLLVKQAMAVDSQFSEAAYQRARDITGLDNPSSVAQLKAWLADQDVPMDSLAKKLVQEKAANTEGLVSELLSLRLELSKTSIKKYETIARCVCRDGRVHGMLQFYGANRTGRWAGRLLQVQNLPQNHLEDLDTAVELGLGHPMGPFKLDDMSGIDVRYNVLKRRYEETGVKSPGFDMIAELYEQGRLGKKTKHGFYDYE